MKSKHIEGFLLALFLSLGLVSAWRLLRAPKALQLLPVAESVSVPATSEAPHRLKAFEQATNARLRSGLNSFESQSRQALRPLAWSEAFLSLLQLALALGAAYLYWRRRQDLLATHQTALALVNEERALAIEAQAQAETQAENTQALLEHSENARLAAEKLNLKLEKDRDERARASRRELEIFSSIAAQELRTELARLEGAAERLTVSQSTTLDEAQAVNDILATVEHLRQSISNFSDYALIDRKAPELTPTSAEAALQVAVERLRPRFEECGAQLRYAENLPRLFADAPQLTRVFENLLARALTDRDLETPLLELQAREEALEWVFELRDNGRGIDEKYSSNALASSSDQGMGLALCRKIVEKHGGRLWWERSPGVGSVYHFTIPKKALLFEGALTTPPGTSDSISPGAEAPGTDLLESVEK